MIHESPKPPPPEAVKRAGGRGPGRRRALVVEDILDGATRLLERAEGDVAGVTLGALARSLGYATSALYRYFPSKEALFSALQSRALAALAADLSTALAAHARAAGGAGGPARRARRTQALERLAVVALAYATLPARSPAHFRLIALSLGDPVVRVPDAVVRPVGAAVGQLLAQVEGLLDAAAQAEAIAPDEPGRAPAVFAALHGALLLDKLARLDLPQLAAATLVPRTLTLSLVGLGAEPRAAEAAVGRAVEVVTRALVGAPLAGEVT